VSLAQHERIVAAVVARDPVAAEAAMRDHITSVIEALSSLAGGQAGTGRPVPAGVGAGRPGR
jgi:DNA-binding FadR family transcriptional regulator